MTYDKLKVYFLLGILLTALYPHTSDAKGVLKVGILVTSGQQRTAYTQVANIFEKTNPGTRIQYIAKNDGEYKRLLDKWLTTGLGPDVLLWQGGERLYRYIRADLILPINNIWQDQQWDNSFSKAAKETVSYQGQVYGVPISYYQWGFYYRKSLFKKFDITVPQTWQQFINMCEVLKSNQITPISLGTKNHWTAAAWFDYLNLRINGYEFHSQLMRGEVLYTSEQVRNVFEFWKELLVQKYFNEQASLYDWAGILPYFYRKKFGVMLIGNFVTTRLPMRIINDVGFFRFPIILPNVPLAEEAPTEVFIISKNTKNLLLAQRFIAFMGRPDIQSTLNKGLGYIAPNLHSIISDDPFIQKGAKMLVSTDHISQYFDRDTNHQMAQSGIKIFSKFLEDRNVQAAISALEEARNQAFNH